MLLFTLSGGAQSKNIFWQVAGKTTLGTTSDFKGIILSKTLISMNTGARLNGRALSQTEVTLIANSVTMSSSVTTTNTPETTTTTRVITPTPTNKAPGFELLLVATAFCSLYLFSRKRR
ncbi:MAG: ice-binding family protein [Candidatus Methanoperedens sp.]|nr:ice-binding family protein [Candidatus Methanoperedens sp.]